MDLIIHAQGTLLQKSDWIDQVIECRKQGQHVLVIHSPGEELEQALWNEGIFPRFIKGHRIINEFEISFIEKYLCHTANRMLVDIFQSKGIQSLGLYGHHAQLIKADYLNDYLGQVGKVLSINAAFLEMMAQNTLVILAQLGVGKFGRVFSLLDEDVKSQLFHHFPKAKFVELVEGQDFERSPQIRGAGIAVG